ncbi:MAG: hypothetical protein Q7R41_13765, partial [Phycisphaerales bacterium]|nr:hypothetical protein [Phycisphaerales bacterium]
MSLGDELVATLDGARLLDALRGPALGALSSDGEPVVFLDPSMRVVGPLDLLESALGESEVVLVPYLAGANENGSQSTDAVSRGVIHPGVLALRAGDRSEAVIEAWPGRDIALRHATQPKERTVFQSWLDAMPVRFPGTKPLLAKHFLVGHWNLDNQDARSNGAALNVGGTPVSLVDFESFDPAQPHLFSTKHDKPALSALPAVADLCAKHASELLATAAMISDNENPFATLPDGTHLDLRLRRLAGKAFAASELTASIFTRNGMEAFYNWLNAPAEHGSVAGLTRYHEAIWKDNDHLRGAYPHLDGPDAAGFAGWLCVHRPPEMPMPDVLLPPEPEHVKAHPPVFDSTPPWGVNVAGFFRSELGLGEAARLLIGALDAAKVPALPVQGSLVPP